MTTTLTWFGHAALGLETGGKKLLIAPYFNGNPAASTTADKVGANFILLTYGHDDLLAITRRNEATVALIFRPVLRLAFLQVSCRIRARMASVRGGKIIFRAAL